MGVTSAQPSVVCIESDLARASGLIATHGSGRRLAALMGNVSEFSNAFDPSLPTVFVLEGLLEYLESNSQKSSIQ